MVAGLQHAGSLGRDLRRLEPVRLRPAGARGALGTRDVSDDERVVPALTAVLSHADSGVRIESYISFSFFAYLLIHVSNASLLTTLT